MKKLISLEKNINFQVNEKVKEFLNPDFIYVPVKDDKLKPKNVKKGELLVFNQYAPVSGKLISIEKCMQPNGNFEKCVVIANDFQEKTKKIMATRKKINNLPKDEFLSCIFDEDLKKKLENNEIKTLVISGIDDDPYIENESFIQKEYFKEILEGIDALLTLYPGCKAILAIKNIESELIVHYTNFIGTYKNIELRLVDDRYLVGKELFLTEVLQINNSYLYFKTSEVYSIYKMVKGQKPDLEKYITITGDGIKNPQIFLVKLGTKIINLLSRFYKEDLSKYDLYVNGILQGKNIDIRQLIVTKDFEGLVIMKQKKCKEKECIKCGKCIDICPIGSNPLLAYKKNKKIKCISCGLCSYICPSYIPLEKYIGGEKIE